MKAKSYLSLSPRFRIGIRRNNPGNLRGSRGNYLGLTTKNNDTATGRTYYAFETVAHGLLALSTLITKYIDQKGLNTISKIVQPYTRGKSGSDRQLWMNQVSHYAGIPATQLLNTQDQAQLKRLCLAIAQKETGLTQTVGGVTATITGQDYDDGLALMQPLLVARSQPSAIALASPILVNPGTRPPAPRFVPQMAL